MQFKHYIKHGIVPSLLMALSVAPAAFAQSETAAPPLAVPTENTAVLIADVAFESIGVHYATSTRTISADAVIRNKFGDISNVIFGLELSGQGVKDAAFDSERITLKEGAVDMRKASLQIPLEVSGKVFVLAVVKSLNGVMLAAEPIWSGTVGSGLSGASPLSCTPAASSVSCTLAKGEYGLSYTVYQNALGGRERLPVVQENAGGKTFSIPDPVLSPGQYVVLIHLTDPRGVVAARTYNLYVSGIQGSIDTLVAQDQDDGSYRIVATTHAFADIPNNFKLTFQGRKKGASCGTPLTIAATSSIAQVVFASGCGADEIVATLYAGGQPLDTVSVFVASGAEGGARSPWFWPAVLATGILLTAIFGVMLARRKPPVPPANPSTPYA